MPDILDWSKFQTYEGDQRKSFERLCYAIAKGEFGDQGTLFPIDDSGGGDGVEFFLRFPNGDEWGWQCKFFYPEVRLDAEKSRKEQIKSSLSVACRKHPNLKKFFLCLPANFTDGERNWYHEKLPTTVCNKKPTVPKGHPVELETWQDSDLCTFLMQERFAGFRRAFFGGVPLSINSFRGQANQTLANVGNQYLPELHTESRVDRDLWFLIGSAETHDKLKSDLSAFEKFSGARHGKQSTFVRVSAQLRDTTRACERALDFQTELNSALDDLHEHMKGMHKAYIGAHFSEALSLEANEAFDSLSRIAAIRLELRDARRHLQANIDELHPDGFNEDGDHYVLKHHRDLEQIILNVSSCASDYHEQLTVCREGALHVLGDAGLGKTHLACHLADRLLKSGKPAIIILGRSLSDSEPLHSQLLKLLDVPDPFSWHDFLSALQAVAEAGYRCRIPIIIDGLNESTDAGRLSEVWIKQLAGFQASLEPFDRVCLITTCRAQYKKRIFSKSPNWNFLDAELPYDANELIAKYFTAFKILTDARFGILRYLRHPLYLRLFCEVTNPDRRVTVTAYLGGDSLFSVFEKFIDKCNAKIVEKRRRRPGTDLLTETLSCLCLHLWTAHSSYLAFDQTMELIDGPPQSQPPWDETLTKSLESEGLLLCRSLEEATSNEVMGFTYDLIAGYLIARSLLHRIETMDELRAWVHSDSIEERLYGSNRHPLHEDIRRCAAAILLAKGIFLSEAISNEEANIDTLRAFYEVRPSQIGERGMDFLVAAFKKPDQRQTILRESELAWVHPRHPAGNKFLDDQLRKLSLSERDTSWSKLLLDHANATKWVEELETYSKFVVETDEPNDQERAHLAARRVMWLLTSTNRPLRDRATRALYWYGRRYPEEFFNLVLSSLSINDPYVWERMLAAAYGVVMALQYEPHFVEHHLGNWSQDLYQQMFAEGAPHSTTHVLARDYASRLIRRGPELLPDQLAHLPDERLKKPFPSGFHREWGTVTSTEFRRLVMKVDFWNYTCTRLIPGSSSYDTDHPEHQKVVSELCWRVQDLGWSVENFRDTDDSIRQRFNELNGYHDEKRVERFGKKYSWIAFYEMAGEREDQGELKSPYTDETEQRWSQGDIDPSFPQPATDGPLIELLVLDSKEQSTQAWLDSEWEFSPGSLWKREQLVDEEGPWLLVSGGFSLEDTSEDRSVWANFGSFFVHPDDGDWVCQQLVAHTTNLAQELRLPIGLRTFAGEVPWSDTFPRNEKPETVLFPKINSEISFSPVGWNLTWESVHSTANPSFDPLYPSRWLVEELGLEGAPDTCDLFDRDGRRGSYYLEHRHKEGPMRSQHYLYVRADLVEALCEKTNAVLIQVLQGVRGHSQKSALELKGRGKKWEELERPFYQARFYPEERKDNAHGE